MNEKIYKRIRDRILFLEYEPGQILNEQVLAKEFGVSRTPLRDVLSRLAWEHLVRILPRTGTMITEIDLNRILHVFQVRLEIEGLVGRLAAEQFSARKIETLQALFNACGRLYEHKDRKSLAAIDIQLRDLFHQTAANPFLTETSERLYALTFRLWFLNMEKGDWHKEVDALVQDLRALPTVIEAGDPLQVGKLRQSQLLRHIERIRAKFLGLTN